MVNKLFVSAVFSSLLFLSGCQALLDYLQNYEGSLWSPTVGDMIYLESADDSFMFGKQYGTFYIQETLTYNILVSQYEVSNAAFKKFVDAGGYSDQGYWTTKGWDFIQQQGITEPLYWNDLAYNSPDQPVVGVSWFEAVAFTIWLTGEEGFRGSYNYDGRIIDLYYDGYRLPTEVEWEYAASKGDPSAAERVYPWGNSWVCNKAVDRVPPCDDYVSGTLAVGSRSPGGDTPQGLADMAGNVAEMVSDTFQQDTDISTNVTTNRYIYQDDPLSMGTYKVKRGGAWRGAWGPLFETSYRDIVGYSERSDGLGFRVVRTYPKQLRP